MSYKSPDFIKTYDKKHGSVSSVSLTEFIASGALSGLRVVRSFFNNQVVYASNDAPAQSANTLGVTLNAAASGAFIRVVTEGPITEPTWNWLPDVPVLLGLNGVLTQVVPASGFVQVIGKPMSPTSLFVRIQQPIIL